MKFFQLATLQTETVRQLCYHLLIDINCICQARTKALPRIDTLESFLQ